jgi:hypothetical protein
MSTDAIEEHVGVDQSPELAALHVMVRESETMVTLAALVAAKVEAMAWAGVLPHSARAATSTQGAAAEPACAMHGS